MIKGLHFLLTYECTYECDHCFLYSGPRSGGTFTLVQIEKALSEAAAMGSIEKICFEGGEPFLYYPLLLAGVKKAREIGFQVGLVTNGYFAVSEADALLWLKPLAEAGVADISISEDRFHNPDGVTPSRAALAIRAAEKLSLTRSVLRTASSPEVEIASEAPLMYRGKAAELLAGQAVPVPVELLDECPYEDLIDPGRVHLDAFGHVHICQGVIIGNMWTTALSKILSGYRAADHPICGPLSRGGPLLLADTYGLARASGYADACHFCYSMRLKLLERFPPCLAPRQVYGLKG
ncbi:MAG: radical SAM protein [Firmicutes bacterium]|nr:radical SAM protein [Bacillota bacterium]